MRTNTFRARSSLQCNEQSTSFCAFRVIIVKVIYLGSEVRARFECVWKRVRTTHTPKRLLLVARQPISDQVYPFPPSLTGRPFPALRTAWILRLVACTADTGQTVRAPNNFAKVFDLVSLGVAKTECAPRTHIRRSVEQ